MTDFLLLVSRLEESSITRVIKECKTQILDMSQSCGHKYYNLRHGELPAQWSGLWLEDGIRQWGVFPAWSQDLQESNVVQELAIRVENAQLAMV